MKTFEFCFHRGSTPEEKQNGVMGPILEKVWMDGHTKASALKAARDYARRMGWVFLADFTGEIKEAPQTGKESGNESHH